MKVEGAFLGLLAGLAARRCISSENSFTYIHQVMNGVYLKKGGSVC